MIVDEDEDILSCFLLFHRYELRRTGWRFFAVNRILVLFWKLRYVFVDTPVDHNARLSSVFLHRIDLNFNSITFQVIRTLDFQYWFNSCIASNKSYQFGSFIISRKRILSTWACATGSCQLNVVSGNKELSRRDVSYNTSVIPSFSHPKIFWKVFKFFCVTAPSFPRLPYRTSVIWLGYIRGCDLKIWVIVHCSNRIPCIKGRMICDSLSKFLARIRYCSVGTKLIHGDNDAQ